MSQSSQAAPQGASPEQETHKIKAGEVFLFVLLGVVPIVLLYIFASQGIHDSEGQQFEQERRMALAACMDALDDREECKGQVDSQIMSCYAKAKPAQSAAPADRAALIKCVSRQPDSVFKERTEEQKLKDAESLKSKKRAQRPEPAAQPSKGSSSVQ